MGYFCRHLARNPDGLEHDCREEGTRLRLYNADVLFGFPIGANALAVLVIASVAAYVRVVTVKASLFSDWLSFIPALLLTNFIFFISLYFSNFSVNYMNLLLNSLSTFIFYPFLWLIFGILINLTKPGSHV